MRRRTMIAGMGLIGAAPFVARAATTSADASIAERFAQTLSAHDIGGFGALFAESYVNHQFSAAAPPSPPALKARAAIIGFFEVRLMALPDLKVTVQTSLAEGDKVAASFAYEGTHEGVYYGFVPTHRRLFFTSCDIFRVADGQIVEHWGMGDIAGILAQLKG